MKNYTIMILMALSLSFAVQASWCEFMCMLSSCCLRTREVAGRQEIERFEQEAQQVHSDQERIAIANQMLLQARTVEQFQAALDAGADVNIRNNNDGRTVLMDATYLRCEDTVRMLLDAGADVNARNNRGSIALMGAAMLGYENIVRLLLDAGADVHARDNDGWTALMNANFIGCEDVVRMLLDAGADVNAQDNDGETALMDAAGEGYEDVVCMLLAAGADVNVRNDFGRTVLMWAVLHGHENIICVLLGWNDQMDALLACDDISDEAKLRLVALESQVVQDALDGIQAACQDQVNLIHNRAIAVRPEMMQMLQDYLSRKSEQAAFDVVKVATRAPAMANVPSVLASQVYEYLTPVSNASSVRNVARSVDLMRRKSQDFLEPFADAAV